MALDDNLDPNFESLLLQLRAQTDNFWAGLFQTGFIHQGLLEMDTDTWHGKMAYIGDQIKKDSFGVLGRSINTAYLKLDKEPSRGGCLTGYGDFTAHDPQDTRFSCSYFKTYSEYNLLKQVLNSILEKGDSIKERLNRFCFMALRWGNKEDIGGAVVSKNNSYWTPRYCGELFCDLKSVKVATPLEAEKSIRTYLIR